MQRWHRIEQTTVTGHTQNSGISATVQAFLFMVAATAALAVMHGIVRYLSRDLDVYTITFFRNLFGLLVVMPLVLRNGLGSLRTTRFDLHALRGITGIGAMLMWFSALAKVEIATATALSFTAALFATLAAVLFLKERIRLRRLGAIVIGFIGVLVVLRPTTQSVNYSALLVLGSTMFWGFNVVVVKTLSKTDRSASIVAWSAILLSLLSFPLLLRFGTLPNSDQLVLLLFIGAFATIGHMCLTTALSMADSTAVMSLDFLRLIWSVMIGVWFFADRIDIWTLVGAVIIFSSGIYIVFRESRATNPATTESANT